MTGQKPAVSKTTCAQGHPLRALARNFTCDVCQRTSPPTHRTVSYCCGQCDWDVCPTHYLPQGQVEEPAAFQWLLTTKCPQNHRLALVSRNTAWNCDRCSKLSSPDTASCYCSACDYDMCPSHLQEATVPPTVPTVPRTLNNQAAASLSDVQPALDAVAVPRSFRCVPVSWEDAQRGTVGGALSCWGGNISDVRLWERNGRQLYTLRTENWNERLGYVSSKAVALMVGNDKAGAPLQAITLASYLQNLKQHAGYAGVETENLYNEAVDGLLTIRFQTVFLPVGGQDALAKVEFCSEVYNYNTRSDDDPRNLLLLATPQGTSVQQDGANAKKVYFHAVDEHGVAKRYWLEAERSEEKVGGEQKESAEAAAAAWARGKSVAVRIGTQAMGTRFNVQMLIQLPLQQRPRPAPTSFGGGGGFFGGPMCGAMPAPCCPPPGAMECDSLFMPMAAACPPAPQKRCSSKPAPVGVSNAARVSRGSLVDTYQGVANKKMQRDASQHGTITVTMYYTVAGGVPSAADITSAIDDLDALYKACPSDKRLVDCTEVTTELTVKTMQDIGNKLATQPYKANTTMPVDNGFPQ